MVSIALLIFSMLNMSSATSIVKTSYGDIGRYQGGDWSSMANSGGYHDDAWTERFAFPILAIVYGLLHNLIAIKIFEKKGSGMAKTQKTGPYPFGEIKNPGIQPGKRKCVHGFPESAAPDQRASGSG